MKAPIFAVGHTVMRCDETTGHVMHAIAFCDHAQHARLLAAAPQLLEALQYVLHCHERCDLTDMQPVRAAIAAATGST